MEEATVKGTVTPLASMFPVEEAQKAAKRVEDTISEKRKELDRLNQFITDNSNLISLVSKLPDELTHPVMVPFGKAAFFPGQLLHTNEFMVLLGESYYAERTAKQTVEILRRRGKALEGQVEALNANVRDLKAEASFFGATASEAAEGLVEIREDYVESSSTRNPHSGDKKITVEDNEYAHIMSRLDELEKEEIAAEGGSGNDESEQTNTDEEDSERDEDEETDDIGSDSDSKVDAHGIDQISAQNYSQKLEHQKNSQSSWDEELSAKYHNQLNVTQQSNCSGLTVQPRHKDAVSDEMTLPNKKVFMLPEVKEKSEEVVLIGKEASTGSNLEHGRDIQSNSQAATSLQTQKSGFDSSKAFTGSIVERNFNVPMPLSQESDAQPPKPVSRFKMQRR